jgi:hypothetical protein
MVSFAQPFRLEAGDDAYPAGDYLVETDEELIEGLTLSAWRRVATTIHVRRDGATQVLPIDPDVLRRNIALAGPPDVLQQEDR